MQLTALEQIADIYDHIYLSPHLDDAVLSCGGAIARHTAFGARVLVVTLCTAAPPAEGPFSPFVAAMHSRWQLSPDTAVTDRLNEDMQALERLGAHGFWAGFADAIYRMPETYTSNDFLFGTPAANDPLRGQIAVLLDELHARAPSATFYVPLAVGNHVDHQLAFEATVRNGWSRTTAFYEDLPYATTPGALEQRMDALRFQFVPSTIDIDNSLSRKLGAIAEYTSQMEELFGGEAAMREQMTTYHEQLRPEAHTYGERLWLIL